MADSDKEVRLMIDKRLRSIIEGRIWDGGVVSFLVKDVDETFFFVDTVKAQDFLNTQSTERFADKTLRKGYFDFVEEHPAGNTVHRYFIDELKNGKIISFREEVI